MKKVYVLIATIAFSTHLFGQEPLAKGDHFVPLNGVKIHYYVRGKGPLCLLPSPGWGPSIGYLTSTLQPLEDFFTIVYYDTKISGQSTGPTDSTKYKSRDFMEDMDSLRIYLKQEKVWIMGHSAGGFQVLNYSIHYSDHLKGIIVLDSDAGGDSLWVAQSYFLPYFYDTVNMHAFLQLDVSQMSEQASRYTSAARFGREYLFPDPGKITVPTLVAVGDDDFICDKVSQGDRIAKNIPGSSELEIRDVGHFSWFEPPQQFLAGCEPWLEKQGIKKQK
jgi:pimeloyl-ACP methyl ester carboxylesterase